MEINFIYENVYYQISSDNTEIKAEGMRTKTYIGSAPVLNLCSYKLTEGIYQIRTEKCDKY